MNLIRDKVAGLDIHRDTVVACCRVHYQGRRVVLTKSPTFPTRFTLVFDLTVSCHNDSVGRVVETMLTRSVADEPSGATDN
jgi:hypothetical protein